MGTCQDGPDEWSAELLREGSVDDVQASGRVRQQGGGPPAALRILHLFYRAGLLLMMLFFCYASRESEPVCCWCSSSALPLRIQ